MDERRDLMKTVSSSLENLSLKAMRQNIFLAFGSILLILVVMELIIRLFNPIQNKLQNPPGGKWAILPEQVWTEPHPTLGWYHQKQKKAILRKDPMEVEVNTNSEGFRGIREYQKQKPTTVRRILSLGDSFVFGWGVKDTETFSAQLEAGNSNLEVINLGVAGYGIDQIMLSFRTIGKQFNPDYVLIGAFPEDFWRATRAYTDAGYGKPFFKLQKGNHLFLNNVPVKSPETLNYVQFPEIVEYSLLERLFLNSVIYRYLKWKTLRLARDLGWIDPDLSEEWRLSQAILKELVSEVRTMGAEPIILIIPPKIWMKDTKPTSVEKSIERFGKRENISVINTTPYLIDAVKKSNVSNFYIQNDEHWTAKAHQLVAELLTQHLLLKTRSDSAAA